MSEVKAMGFVTACSKFFGRLEGQNLSQFRDEMKALTPKDRADLAPLLSEVLGAQVSAEELAPK